MANTTKTYNLTDANFDFYKFQIVSKKSGKSFDFQMFGNDREDAKENLLNGALKGTNWNRWNLVEC